MLQNIIMQKTKKKKLIHFNRHAEDDDVNAPPPQIQAAIKNNDIGNLLDLDWDEPAAETPKSPVSPAQQTQQGSLNDLLSIGGSFSMSPQPESAKPVTNTNDILSLFNTSPTTTTTTTTITTSMKPANTQPVMDLTDDLFGIPTQTSTTNTANTQQKSPTKDPFIDLL